MRDQLLFVVAPGLAALRCVTSLLMMYVTGRRGEARPPRSTPDDEAGVVLPTWGRCAIGIVLIGHALAFAFPGTILRWDRQLLRLIVLESIGLTTATVALVSLFLTSVRHLRRHPSSFASISTTLLLLQVLSGLTIAVRYRWASSWAEVTLTPYVRSL